jgi:hypothetical protein
METERGTSEGESHDASAPMTLIRLWTCTLGEPVTLAGIGTDPANEFRRLCRTWHRLRNCVGLLREAAVYLPVALVLLYLVAAIALPAVSRMLLHLVPFKAGRISLSMKREFRGASRPIRVVVGEPYNRHKIGGAGGGVVQGQRLGLARSDNLLVWKVYRRVRLLARSPRQCRHVGNNLVSQVKVECRCGTRVLDPDADALVREIPSRLRLFPIGYYPGALGRHRQFPLLVGDPCLPRHNEPLAVHQMLLPSGGVQLTTRHFPDSSRHYDDEEVEKRLPRRKARALGVFLCAVGAGGVVGGYGITCGSRRSAIGVPLMMAGALLVHVGLNVFSQRPLLADFPFHLVAQHAPHHVVEI